MILYSLFLQNHNEKMAFMYTVSANTDYEAIRTFHGIVDRSNNSDFANHVYYRKDSMLHKALEIYFTPALAVFSLIGNTLIFAVFSMRLYKNNLTAMLYQVLALADGISVVIRVAYHTLPPTSISCKLIMFMLCWSGIVSAWLIAVITAARVIIVWFPHKSKQINTKWKYIYTIVALVNCV